MCDVMFGSGALSLFLEGVLGSGARTLFLVVHNIVVTTLAIVVIAGPSEPETGARRGAVASFAANFTTSIKILLQSTSLTIAAPGTYDDSITRPPSVRDTMEGCFGY
jgi:hypothetical protein